MAFPKAIRLFFFYPSGRLFVGLLWVGILALLLPFAALHAAVSDTRLVEAAKKADRAAVRALLQEGVDINGSSADGTTALLWAVDRDDLEIADMLIRADTNFKATNRYGVARSQILRAQRTASFAWFVKARPGTSRTASGF